MYVECVDGNITTFNVSDWLGILTSIALIDTLGRKGFFAVFENDPILRAELSLKVLLEESAVQVPHFTKASRAQEWRKRNRKS